MANHSTTETVLLTVNGKTIRVPEGTVVAAAVALTGEMGFRKSVLGQPRGPLCGMGICMECRVRLNGQPHQRSCQILCAEGMEVRTDV